jgi:hypothetical protein
MKRLQRNTLNTFNLTAYKKTLVTNLEVIGESIDTLGA